MKIVIPMAGHGLRFANAGYDTPKPLIDVLGEPMLSWALKSLKEIPTSQLIFIILKAHEERYGLASTLRDQYQGAEIIVLDEVTEGTARYGPEGS